LEKEEYRIRAASIDDYFQMEVIESTLVLLINSVSVQNTSNLKKHYHHHQSITNRNQRLSTTTKWYHSFDRIKLLSQLS